MSASVHVCVCRMLLEASAAGGDVIYADLVLQHGYIPGEHHKFSTKFPFQILSFCRD